MRALCPLAFLLFGLGCAHSSPCKQIAYPKVGESFAALAKRAQGQVCIAQQKAQVHWNKASNASTRIEFAPARFAMYRDRIRVADALGYCNGGVRRELRKSQLGPIFEVLKRHKSKSIALFIAPELPAALATKVIGALSSEDTKIFVKQSSTAAPLSCQSIPALKQRFGFSLEDAPGGPRITEQMKTVRTSSTADRKKRHKKQIGHVIRKNIDRFKHCYEVKLNETPTLKGKIILWFFIDQDGVVRYTERLLDTVHPWTGNCVELVMRSLRFSMPVGQGPVIVTYPFHFAYRTKLR